MQKYVLVKFLEGVADELEFSVDAWPLHVTLAANFSVDWENTDLHSKLDALLARKAPIKVTAGHDEYFGPAKQTRVTVLHMTPALVSLHKDIFELLKQAGAIFDEPRYLNEGYRAHATVQAHRRLNEDDEILIDELTIVDMFPHNDISQRKILRTIKLTENFEL